MNGANFFKNNLSFSYIFFLSMTNTDVNFLTKFGLKYNLVGFGVCFVVVVWEISTLYKRKILLNFCVPHYCILLIKCC